uniref:NAD-dependent protein deacetylase n=1 Tax=Crassostrea virginica TaxID=6565 RepID=A0A8B8BLJ4_CRAVI|nr:NAD-dependent protein deacetylase sirtuin-2-like [Crassostrea virginica]
MAGIGAEKNLDEAGDQSPSDDPIIPVPEDEARKPKKELTKDEEFLKEYLARSFGLRPPPKQVLSTVDIQGIANLISEGKVRKVITMAGAGISTSAGIPDFRSMNTGLYSQLDKFNLPRPEALFSIDYFKENPIPYYTVRKQMLLENYKPTPCHYFIRMLAEKGILLRHFTQNIDGLERVAGIDPELLMEAHGSNRTGQCLHCSATYTAEWIKDCLIRNEIPKCTAVDCTGVIKPDTVFYGESLPKRFSELVDQDFCQCDLLIILGTSLKVQPFAGITNKVPVETPRLYINLEKNASESKHPLCILIFGGGFKFDDEDNYRDVFLQSKCDDGCYKLAELLGWKDELSNLVTSEHARLGRSSRRSKKKLNNFRY